MSDRSEKAKFQNNPFAICSASIDREKEPAKWERCVMDVKKKQGLSENVSEAFGDDFPSGGYLAEMDDDGQFWNIRDVPFFSELPAGTRSNETSISREWMEAVISRHRELESQQKYLPAVHANHHGDGRETFRIGFLRPTRVGRLVLDGKLRWTLFGDIIRVENNHFEQIKDMRYPYRSAEIGRGWKPEIASLALSEDEAPHFKLPMLTIGEERRHFDREFLPSERPAMAFSEVGDSAYVCFSFRGTAMPKEEKTEKLAEHANANGNDKDKGKENLQEENEVANKLAKVIADFEKGLPALLASFLQGLLPPTDRTDEGETQVEPAMLKARIAELLNAKVVETKEDDKTVNKLSELRGEMDAFKEKERLREETKTAESLAESKIKELQTEGWHLSEEAVASIRDIAGESKPALEKYVKAYKATMPKDPPRTLEEAEVFSQDSPDISKYKTRSPEVLEQARNLSLQYDELKEGGANLTATREEFIDINLETLAV